MAPWCSVVDRAINCLTNDNLINVINPKIDGILPLVPRVESLIKQVENLSSQLTAKFAGLPEDFQKSKMTENTQQLKRTAEAVIITAGTVIESQTTIVDGKDRQRPSSSGSGQLPEELQERLVEKWISHLTVNHGEMEPDSDIISELMPDDSVSCIALKKNKRSQPIDEAEMPGSSPDTTKNVDSPTNMSTGRDKLMRNVFEEGSAHLSPFDETSSSSKDLNFDTVSIKTRTAYRADHNVDTSYNKESAKELLAVLGTDPEAKEWKVNDALFDLVKMKAGKGVRSSSNMAGTLLYLLEKGGDVNAKNAESITPLHWASEEGNAAVVELLVERDADTNMRDKIGWTALHIAAYEGHTSVVEVLLNGGAAIEYETKRSWNTALTLAASYGRALTVEYLLKAGALVNPSDKNACTPLLCASARGHVGVVETLLKAGALVDFKPKDGETPLIKAAKRGHKTTIELLLAAGADIKTRSITGSTAIHVCILKHRKDCDDCAICAGSESRENIVKLLCQKGADPSVMDDYGNFPLSMIRKEGVCSREERKALTRVLKKFGAR